ncbi:hypothetical protein MKEN_01255800 [Mycena kentingensis (nom. inval.)]|nr:hypothetical protein MKEN_01255800 [Mycena kentingensis (nom. inval.)]
MTPNITLYDIASSLPETTFSPNVAKAKYVLDLKGIPYKTIWVEYPEIAPLCKKIGAKATKELSAVAPYTCPIIHDASTGAIISDSFEIARYLDSTYPETPRIIPEGTTAFHYAFIAAFEAKLAPLVTYALPATLLILNAASQEYFARTKAISEFGGMPLKEVFPPPGSERDLAVWKDFQAMLDGYDAWMAEEDKFFMGDTLSFADVTFAGWLYWVRLVLSKEKWADIESWNGGRWARLMKEFAKYE